MHNIIDMLNLFLVIYDTITFLVVSFLLFKYSFLYYIYFILKWLYLLFFMASAFAFAPCSCQDEIYSLYILFKPFFVVVVYITYDF